VINRSVFSFSNNKPFVRCWKRRQQSACVPLPLTSIRINVILWISIRIFPRRFLWNILSTIFIFWCMISGSNRMYLRVNVPRPINDPVQTLTTDNSILNETAMLIINRENIFVMIEPAFKDTNFTPFKYVESLIYPHWRYRKGYISISKCLKC
jgi:hypothetical protein